MAKTDKQKLVEAEHPGKRLPEILTEVLENHRGQNALVEAAGKDLGLSKGTMAAWCREYRIETDQYKRAVAVAH